MSARLLQYQTEAGSAQRLLYEFLNPELKNLPPRHKKFRANRSMRDVEPSVNLWLKTIDGVDIEGEEACLTLNEPSSATRKRTIVNLLLENASEETKGLIRDIEVKW